MKQTNRATYKASMRNEKLKKEIDILKDSPMGASIILPWKVLLDKLCTLKLIDQEKTAREGDGSRISINYILTLQSRLGKSDTESVIFRSVRTHWEDGIRWRRLLHFYQWEIISSHTFS